MGKKLYCTSYKPQTQKMNIKIWNNQQFEQRHTLEVLVFSKSGCLLIYTLNFLL